MFVRLKPNDPRQGYVLRRYTYQSIRYDAGRNWEQVDARVAEYLRGVHAVPDDHTTPLAFDVVATEKEAAAISASDPPRAGYDDGEGPSEKARPSEGILTTADLPKPRAKAQSGRRSSKRG